MENDKDSPSYVGRLKDSVRKLSNSRSSISQLFSGVVRSRRLVTEVYLLSKKEFLFSGSNLGIFLN